MSITFVCSCGKRLRAREEMASRRSMCPRCGAPVGIPSLQSNHPGGLRGPLSPEEISRRRNRIDPEKDTNLTSVGPAAVRIRRGANRNAEEQDWRPLDGNLVCPAGQDPTVEPSAPGKPAARVRRRRSWQLESRWYHCLAYPLRAWPVVVGLSLGLAALTAAATLLLPGFHDFHADSAQGWLPALLILLPLLIVGYTAGFLDGVLLSGILGESQQVRWPGYNLQPVIVGAVRWLVCFLAGPILPATVGVWFWLSCGDPAFIDRVILGELAVVTVGLWLLTLVAVADGGRLRDASPPAVVDLFQRLGWRSAVPLVVVPALAFVHGRMGLTAVEELHRDPAAGVLLLAGVWLSALFCGTYFFRLLGLWCLRTRPQKSLA
jgi:hypothetical protein